MQEKMYLKIVLLFLITAYVKADDVLPYIMEAYTTSGAPCIGGCSPDTHQCVASWPVKTEPCEIRNKAAPIFRTTRSKTLYPYCLSNCGYYAWRTPWCFVTTDGKWDDCIPMENQEAGSVEVHPYTTIAFTTTGVPCIGGCSPKTKQCIAHWPPKNEHCVDFGTRAPIAYTTQSRETYTTCLSNCGAYGVKDPWCYVTKDGKWDYCTPTQTAVIVNTNINNGVNSNGNALVLPYNEISFTLTGAPCIGGCSPDTNQCVASFPPKNEPCVRFGISVPKPYTIKRYTTYSTCLSNCGTFAHHIPWCYVTNDGKWDHCTLQQSKSIHNTTTNVDVTKNQNALVLSYDEEANTLYGAPCIGGCSPDTRLCVSDYPPKNEPCVSSNVYVPKFHTTQTYSRHRFCLSNCGFFAGRNFAWCYVTYDGHFDTCYQQRTHQNLPISNQTNQSNPEHFHENIGTEPKQSLDSDASTPKILNLTSFR